MPRRRQQDGYIFKARGMWYLRYFDARVMGGEVKRVRIAKQLAPVTGITKTRARELARPIMAQINQPRHAPETAVSLTDFVERVYLPRMERQKRPSTVKGYWDIWENHLKARSAGLWMREIRTCDVQRILDEISRLGLLGSNSLRHIKSQISGIFSYAKQQGYFDGENPARNTAVPPARPSEETYAYSLEEIGQIIALLPEPAATIFSCSCVHRGTSRRDSRAVMGELSRRGNPNHAVHLEGPHNRAENAQEPRRYSGDCPACKASGVSPHPLRQSNLGGDVPQLERLTYGPGECT